MGSCSNLGDAQARRLGIRIHGKDGNYFAHTLNNTCVAPPRMLIAFLENHLQADGTIYIPEVLRPYMGGKDKLVPRRSKDRFAIKKPRSCGAFLCGKGVFTARSLHFPFLAGVQLRGWRQRSHWASPGRDSH